MPFMNKFLKCYEQYYETRQRFEGDKKILET
jgi:hypothetical protein